MTKQKEFIHNEIWTLTFGAAFQRANIYKDQCTDLAKSEFKSETRKYVTTFLFPLYNGDAISDEEHIKNIYKLSDFTTRFHNILNNGRLNFGASQKILNLFLKYMWCLYEAPIPPHFPVDRRIQENIGFRPIISWTTFENETGYMEIINFARNSLSIHPNIAEFELEHFERRIKTDN